MKKIMHLLTEMILLKLKTFIPLLIMSWIVFVIVIMAGEVFLSGIYRVMVIRDTIDIPDERVYYLKNTYMSESDWDFGPRSNELLKELEETFPDEIEIAAAYSMRDVIKLPAEPQSRGPEIVFLNDAYLKMCGIDTSGYPKREDCKTTLVGANLKGAFPEEYTVKTDFGLSFYIAASLEPGTKLIPQNIYGSDDDSKPLDGRLVVVQDMADENSLIYSNDIYIIIDDTDVTQSVLQTIERLNAKYNTGYAPENIKQTYSNLVKNCLKTSQEKAVFLVFSVIICIISVTTMNMVDILLHKKMYGIYYANGFTSKDMRGAVILTDTILFTTSMMLAWAFCCLRLKGKNPVVVRMITDIHYRYIWTIIIPITVICIIISGISAALYLDRKTPAELVRG
ncbi:MAG: hypothetical protein K6G03_06495 [Lachnospiraceae bacterium]|nr:hypothetical protein [Lachnospiraceae bacterium]